MSNPEVILHWYHNSPFGQKVAFALLYKKVDFKTVNISPVEPRPLRRPLDGGYRKTPILQIGNHTFCDSKAIFAELERRYPEPSFYPAGPNGESTESLALGFGRWTDNTLFQSITTQLPFGLLDDAFLQDRAKFSGRAIKKETAAFVAPFMKQSLVAEFQLAQKFVSERNKNGAAFALGTDKLSMVDLHIAMLTWFARSLIGPGFLKTEIPVLDAHLKKVLAAINYKDLKKVLVIEAEQALEVAKNQTWTLANATSDGSLPIPLGKLVSVTPTDTGKVPVIGTLVHSTIDETVVERKDKETGITAYIHFPVLGYLVLPINYKL